MKKVFKYGTGQPIPDGAVYLNTIKQTERFSEYETGIMGGPSHKEIEWIKCWFVWHYFLVETEERE